MLVSVDVEEPAPVLPDVSAHPQQRFPDLDPTVVEAAVRLAHRDVARMPGRRQAWEVEAAARDRLTFALRAGRRVPRPRGHGG